MLHFNLQKLVLNKAYSQWSTTVHSKIGIVGQGRFMNGSLYRDSHTLRKRRATTGYCATESFASPSNCPRGTLLVTWK